MPNARLNPGPALRAAMRYPRFAEPVPRMLVLESQYWIDQACLRAADRLGWTVARAPVPLAGALANDTIAQLIQTLAAFRPDFALTVNLGGMDENGLIAEIFDTFGVPLVSWFVDDPRTIMLDRAHYGTPSAIAFTWEPAYADYLRDRGFPRVEALPLAADAALFDAPPREDPPLPPVFVGNSMTGFAESEWAWIAERPALADAVLAAFQDGRVDRENFAKGIDALLGPAAAALDPHERRHAEMYCFIEGTRRARATLLAALAPHGVIARGDPAWAQVTPHHGTYVGYTTELPHLYRDSLAHVNATSIQMASAVNQRVFDGPAAGALVITDDQPQLRELFEPDETVVYTTPGGCAECLARYRADPPARTALVRRAQARIRDQHTYSHRIERIAQVVREQLECL